MCEVPTEVELLRGGSTVWALTREDFGRADREEPHHSRRTEQKGIVVFRTGWPDVSAVRKERTLGFPFARRLDTGNPERPQESLRLLHHRPRKPRCHDRFGPPRGPITGDNGGLILPLPLPAGRSSPTDLL